MPNLGDIGLTQVSGLGGKLIHLAQILDGSGLEASKWQHSFVYVGNDHKVEAEPGGARLRLVDGRQATLWLRCPPEYGQFVAARALGFIGTPYSWADYFALAAIRLHAPFAGPLHNFVHDTGHMMCSQLAAEAAVRGGWKIVPDPQNVTPAGLAKIALEALNADRH